MSKQLNSVLDQQNFHLSVFIVMLVVFLNSLMLTKMLNILMYTVKACLSVCLQKQCKQLCYYCNYF